MQLLEPFQPMSDFTFKRSQNILFSQNIAFELSSEMLYRNVDILKCTKFLCYVHEVN